MMILRMAAGSIMGGVVLAGAAATLALGAGAVGAVLLARRVCEERRGWQDGAKAEAVPEPGLPEAGLADPA